MSTVPPKHGFEPRDTMDDVLDDLLTRADQDLASSLEPVLDVAAGLDAIVGHAVSGSLLAYLEPADREFLLSLGFRRTFSAGEILLHQGDPTNHVLVLVSGWVRIYSSTSDGQDVLVALRGPGDVIGDQSALHGWPRTASVQALERVVAIQMLSAPFAACLRDRSNIAIAMIKQMSERLRESETARVDYATLDVTRRVATYLMRLMHQHGVRDQGGFVLHMPLTQQDIANRIGASRRAVARSMAALRKRQIVVTLRRGVVVLRPEALNRAARLESAISN